MENTETNMESEKKETKNDTLPEANGKSTHINYYKILKHLNDLKCEIKWPQKCIGMS